MHLTSTLHFEAKETVELEVTERLSPVGVDPYWVVRVFAATPGVINSPTAFFCATPDQVRAFVPDYQSTSEIADAAEHQATIDTLVTRAQKAWLVFHEAQQDNAS